MKKKYICKHITYLSSIYSTKIINWVKRQFPIYRCNMAGGGHADVFTICIAMSAADDGNDSFTLDTDSWLGHLRIECLQRLHCHHHLDCRIPHDKSPGTEVQTRITRGTRVQIVYGVQCYANNFFPRRRNASVLNQRGSVPGSWTNRNGKMNECAWRM